MKKLVSDNIYLAKLLLVELIFMASSICFSGFYWRNLRFVSHLLLLAVYALLAGCASNSLLDQPESYRAEQELTIPRAAHKGYELDTLGLVAYATSMQGKPYVEGGSAPQIGFDCSGLVYHVFGQFDLVLPRSVREIADRLPPVPLGSIQPADLLLFNTQGHQFSHVGIYLGDGRFVHAPSPKSGRVIISQVTNQYWRPRITGVRRVSGNTLL